MYLIIGVWFQKRTGLGIAYDHTGAVPVWQTAICRSMYSGGFGRSPADSRIFTGNMVDPAGPSELSDITLSEKELSFTKRYYHRDDLIKYTFKKQSGGTWKGNYFGHACGTGFSRCVINQVSEDFLLMD
jgi:hypothetical protein